MYDILAILLIIIILILYNVRYFSILKHARPNCNKIDLYSTWGRKKVRDRIYLYFEHSYADKYIKHMNLLYPILLICVLLLISIVII